MIDNLAFTHFEASFTCAKPMPTKYMETHGIFSFSQNAFQRLHVDRREQPDSVANGGSINISNVCAKLADPIFIYCTAKKHIV